MSSLKDSEQEVELPTSYLLSQVIQSVKSRAPTASARVPTRTTWAAALETAQKSLQSHHNQELVVFPRQTKERQQALRKLALSYIENPPPGDARVRDVSNVSDGGLAIRTDFPKHGTLLGHHRQSENAFAR